jgi:GAF domain-containing protein
MRILTDTLAKRVDELEQQIVQRQQREREIEAIAAVSVALRTSNTQAEMLPIVLEQVASLVSASGAALAMRDPAGGELVMALAQGEMANLAGLRLPAGAGIGGQAVATRQPYTTDDVSADPHWYQPNWTGAARAAASVPLITSQHVLGVLWAVRAMPFTAVEVRVLSAIAGIAASAIQRAGLHEQTEQRLQRLAALREIDSAIMHSLDLSTTLALLIGHVTAQLGVDAGRYPAAQPRTERAGIRRRARFSFQRDPANPASSR